MRRTTLLPLLFLMFSPSLAHAKIVTERFSSLVATPITVVPASQPVAVIGLNAVQDRNESLAAVTVLFKPASGSGFKMTDIESLALNAGSGVALYRDNASAGVNGKFDSTDLLVTAGFNEYDPTYARTVNRFGFATPVPTDDKGANAGDDFFIVIRTSRTFAQNHGFTVSIPPGGVRYTGGATSAVGAGTGETAAVTVDTTGPTISSRATIDADGDGLIDHIQFTASEPLNDDFSGVKVVVDGLGDLTATTGRTANDATFEVSFTETPELNSGSVPGVWLYANTSLRDRAYGGAPPNATGVTSGGTLMEADPVSVTPTDKAAPQLRAYAPVTGSTDVTSAMPIQLDFSEPMDTGAACGVSVSVNYGPYLSLDSSAHYSEGNKGGIDSRLTFSPPVAPGSVIGVRIGSGCADRAHNTVVASSLPTSWTYTTAPVNDYPPLAFASDPGIDPAATTANAADIVWVSSRPATGRIEWGKTADYTAKASEKSVSLAHRIHVPNILPATVYHGRACLSALDQTDVCSDDFTFTVKDTSDRRAPVTTYGPVADADGVISWFTDEPSDSKLEFGSTTAYGTVLSAPVYSSEHHVRLPVALSATVPVHFRIVPTDVNGNSAPSADSTLYAIGAGSLITSAASSAVYFVDENGVRHPYPNEMTYFSWETDFSQVLTVSAAQLAGIPLGAPATVRPGTYLVKIVTEPKTYAVTAGGVLHELVDETQAIALYGAQWASRVRDVPDEFFVSYTIGSPVFADLHPDGTLILLPDGSYLLAPDGTRRAVSPAGFSANRFNPAFTVTPTAADLHRQVGAPLVTAETLGWH